MMRRPRLLLFAIAAMLAVVGFAARPTARPTRGVEHDAEVDAIFSRFTSTTPGCAVAVSVGGQVVIEKAYGMADLEHDIPIKPDTIFEIGSASKQFTAAAVLLLARDGKLSLDDPARKYLPELPDYGLPLTIRHMLTHTSGLRDWGSIVGIAGWPRTTRVHTHAHVLDIVSRQRALNFPSGTRWSYSNTGYNLAAVIVSRVSGQSFAEFTRARIFEPLGMTRTSWRDDYTRIVKDRAIAYDDGSDGRLHMNMPFENIHGNGALLSTVGDLLKWNENFVSPMVGDAAFVAAQQMPGRFSDGRAHDYAFGLFVGRYKGLAEVNHGGATAGYRSHLTRFPDQRVSVAVLCNAGASSRQAGAAHAVADLYLASHLKPPTPAPPRQLTPAEIDAVAGLYAAKETGELLTIVRSEDALRFETDGLQTADGPTARGGLLPLSASRFLSANGRVTLDISGNTARRTDPFGTVDSFDRVTRAKPTASKLTALVGRYVSDEAEVLVDVAVEGESLVIKRRPDSVITLTPLYDDAFRGSIGLVRFHRDAAGAVRELSVALDRVWDLRFKRQ
jgi:CubicO group peptidase (beta-lactamase class C family)